MENSKNRKVATEFDSFNLEEFMDFDSSPPSPSPSAEI
jgi:hypothetical protein